MRPPLIHFIATGEVKRPAVEVRCKTGYGASTRRMLVHHVLQMAGVRERDRMRFVARWLCGNGSLDVVVVVDPDAHGGVCERCTELALGPVVYRCFDASRRLLYVGSTGSGATTRLQFHERNASWWPEVADIETELHPTLGVARAAESLAIRTEQPIHNIQGRPRGRSAIAERAS